MARPLTQTISPARWLAIAIVASLVLSLTPAKHTLWVDWFGSLVVRLVAPVTHPLTLFTRWISPATRVQVDPGVVARAEDAERFRTLYLRAQRENEELRARIRDLQSGVALNPQRPVSLIGATVIGTTSDLRHPLLRTRVGTEIGIDVNTVVTYRGTRLLGRVVRAGRGLSEILTITDRSSTPLLGRVILRDDGAGRRCTLVPVGDGTLEGPVEDPRERPDLAHIALEPGMLVRLDDGAWPSHAQMLEIGVIEQIRPSEQNPLRQVVVVRPSVDLTRVSEVEFRVEQDRGGGAFAASEAEDGGS